MVSPEPYIKATLNNSPLAAGGSGFANYTRTLSNYQTSPNYAMKFQGGHHLRSLVLLGEPHWSMGYG